ncbi:MAG: isocitrate/isopropylmalate family dehydrogenase, partial [Methermicoccaceae archaeon]
MKIAVIEGDGVGREVIPAALRVLDAVHPDIKKVFLEVGAERFYRDGISISKDDINTIRDCDCLLFGAVDTPLEKGYTSVVLTLRKSLGLFSNIRPFKSHPALTDKEFDFVIVRENTEGMYSGREKVREDEAWTTRVISRVGSERICRLAASIAMERGDRLTIVHKANILHSDRFFRDVCTGCVEDAGVEYDEMLVDACAYHLVRTPQRFGVIVT